MLSLLLLLSMFIPLISQGSIIKVLAHYDKTKSLRVLGALLGSSFVGYLLENRYVPNTGILGTMMVAALCQPFLPTQHVLYDLCWTLFLPASLTLLLLSIDNNNEDQSLQEQQQQAISNTVGESIRTMFLPFLMASIGSIVGCIVSFLCVTTLPQVQLLSPMDAAVAASCLCASFVGGSVNFFGTARIIARDNPMSTTLLGSMAAADLVVMALYFTMIGTILPKSRFSALLFSSYNNNNNDTTSTSTNKDDQVNVSTTTTINDKENTSRHPSNVDSTMRKDDTLSQTTLGNNKHMIIRKRLLPSMVVSILAVLIVLGSNQVQDWMAPILPGTSCAVIAIVAPLLQPCFAKWQKRRQSSSMLSFWKDMQQVASPLSELSFYIFIASIGISANLREALLQKGPTCICFSLVALMIHILIALMGSYQMNQIGIRRKNLFSFQKNNNNIHLEDVLVASNAAIGGASTAATFAGRMMPQGHPKRKGLIIAGTVWGVVGYAFGTTLGVLLFRILSKFVKV